MIYNTIKLKPTKQKITFELIRDQKALLMPVGDIHWYSTGFPVEKLRTHFQWGMDRGATFFGMGDYLEWAPASQRKLIGPLRDSQKGIIDEFVKRMLDELLDVIGFTKGHWIGLIEGNHRHDFLDSTCDGQYLANALGCDFYGTSALMRLHPSGVRSYHHEADTIMFAHHGTGSAITVGGQLVRVERLMEWINADLYLMGHSHSKVNAPVDEQHISPDGVHYHRTKIVARTGGWFRGYLSSTPRPLNSSAMLSRGSYVEEKALMPSSMGGLCIAIGVEQIVGSKYYRPVLHYSV